MKADRWGTPTEQVRHRAGWQSGRQKDRLESCRDCCWAQNRKKTWRCNLHEFATAVSAVCDSYRADELDLEVSPGNG